MYPLMTLLVRPVLYVSPQDCFAFFFKSNLEFMDKVYKFPDICFIGSFLKFDNYYIFMNVFSVFYFFLFNVLILLVSFLLFIFQPGKPNQMSSQWAKFSWGVLCMILGHITGSQVSRNQALVFFHNFYVQLSLQNLFLIIRKALKTRFEVKRNLFQSLQNYNNWTFYLRIDPKPRELSWTFFWRMSNIQNLQKGAHGCNLGAVRIPEHLL